ncbi:MAG: hypothetical protein ACRDQD_12420 [Nocardioidaceae bacterium]
MNDEQQHTRSAAPEKAEDHLGDVRAELAALLGNTPGRRQILDELARTSDPEPDPADVASTSVDVEAAGLDVAERVRDAVDVIAREALRFAAHNRHTWHVRAPLPTAIHRQIVGRVEEILGPRREDDVRAAYAYVLDDTTCGR